jgi:hypothetical protein
MISPADHWRSPAQIAHRLLLPDVLRPFADAFIAAMPGDAWTFAFASGYGARVTRVDDDAWLIHVVVPYLETTEEYPFLPRHQPISAAAASAAMEMLRETPWVETYLDDEHEIIQAMPALKPLEDYLNLLIRIRCMPAYAELMFKFMNHGIIVRWAPANAAIGLDSDTVAMEIRRISIGFYNRITVGDLLQEIAVANVAEAADILGVIERRGVGSLIQKEGGQQ